jgi:hypothetical protein
MFRRKCFELSLGQNRRAVCDAYHSAEPSIPNWNGHRRHTSLFINFYPPTDPLARTVTISAIVRNTA